VWKKRKGFVLKLYLFLRYYSLSAAVTICFGYFSPVIGGEACQRWMFFIPFGLIIPLMLFSGTLMAIRIYAIYNRSKLLLGFLLSILIAQASVGTWIWTTPGAHPAPDLINNYLTHYCIFIPATSLGPSSAGYAFMELSFDSVCFALTLIRPIWGRIYRNETWGNQLFKNLAQNGVLYFGVIFSVNLTWAIMILHASTGLRGSAAAPSSMIMSSFIARITLNLRSSFYGQNVDEITVKDGPTYATDQRNANTYQLRQLRAPQKPGLVSFVTSQFVASDPVEHQASYLDLERDRADGVWVEREIVTTAQY